MIPDEDEMKQFPVRYGKVVDPDGYTIEISEAKSSTSPSISKITLGVLDPVSSIPYNTLLILII